MGAAKSMNNVLIVGAGPIGLFLALELARYEINVKIIDKITASSRFTKALTINSSSLKVFHGAGIVKRILKAGRILSEAEVYFYERKVAHLNKKYLDSVHNYFLSIPQPETEAILKDELFNRGIQVNFHEEIIGIIQDKNGVEAKIHNLKNDSIQRERFDFVVGCDGAHSSVRKLIGLTFTGHDYDMYFIISDVYFEEGYVVEKSTYFIDDTGFIGTFLMSNGCTRVVIRKDGFLPKEKPIITQEEIQEYLDLHLVKKPLKIKKMLWSSCAQIITRTCETGRVNRVFIAGDAYHLFSPIGGHNMNSGFQDAFNLGWKLAYYIHGLANDFLLTTYADERAEAINKLLKSTNLNTLLVMRKNKNHEKLEYFKPNFSNRSYYRNQFPFEFSGYFADYSTGENILVGKHVPYIKFAAEYNNISSTYDIPIHKKFFIFFLSSFNKKTLLQKIFSYRSIIELIEVKEADRKIFVEKLDLKSHLACIIRPDGFVGLLGDVKEIFLYLSSITR